MAEYICREAIIDDLEKEIEAGDVALDEDVWINKGLRIAIRDIKDIKTADVQPVRHGRWIEKPPYKDETVKGLEFQIVCSECDEQNCSLEFDENYNAIGKTFYRTRYCPNCGARMIKDGDAE